MRSTRSNTIPSTCYIFSVPPEIIQYMMGFMPTSSLVSIARCSKRLRDHASPVLLRSIKIITNRKDNFTPLLKLATDTQKSSRLRHLSFVDGKPKYSIERDKAASKNLASVLSTFVNLTSLEIPFPFLSHDLFNLVHAHPSITILKIGTAVERWRTNDLNTEDRSPLPPRTLPLVVPSLSAELYISSDDYYQLGRVLDFLTFHGVIVQDVNVHNHQTGPQTALRLPGSRPGRLESSVVVPSLVSFHIAVGSEHCPISLDWVAKIFNTNQTSLQEVHLVVNKYGGFRLGPRIWRSNWSDALPSVAPGNFYTWPAATITKYKAVITRNGVRKLSFEANQDLIIRPDLITHLSSLAPTLVSLDLAGGWLGHLLFPDLDATISAFFSLTSLAHLVLKSSLTPSPTVRKVVSCSAACYARLKKDHPAIFQAAEVVGGYRAFWKIGVEVNRARFARLVAGMNAPSQSEDGTSGGKLKIELRIVERDRFLFGLSGLVRGRKEGGGRIETIRETTDEEGISDASSEKWKAATSCFVCETSYFVGKGDPASSLMELSPSEVRTALEVGGFNFKKFASKKKSSSATPDSFEAFLRSAT